MSVLILDSDYDELLKLRRKNHKNKKLQEKCKRLTNNWNELEEYLLEYNACMTNDERDYYEDGIKDCLDEVLDKMKEIKENK